ncbi:hypothetical protein Pcinc_008549 [Petrolisthes cinctipes]|uniref:Integrase p58-like C-terminal domain-containing protein n=1 Tax=Petrolisthes cinctipes TaxID=88211 RepID=A0AAE1G8M4_PETCI|nr:hypothetical protein Pcinc_008549 [Petrolisthes cinctipes]
MSHSRTQVPDPQVALEIEKVKLQAMQLKLQYELAERESTKLKIQQHEQDREERGAERVRAERLQELHIQEAREQRQHELQVLQLQQGNPTRGGTLEKVRKYAKENLKNAQALMKSDYDLKAKAREFHEGDEVLAYFPIPGSSLSAKYHGPYTVKRKADEFNYIINTPDRRKTTQLVHINLLKAYLTQEPAPDQLGLACNVINTCKDETLETSDTNMCSSLIQASGVVTLPEVWWCGEGVDSNG